MDDQHQHTWPCSTGVQNQGLAKCPVCATMAPHETEPQHGKGSPRHFPLAAVLTKSQGGKVPRRGCSGNTRSGTQMSVWTAPREWGMPASRSEQATVVGHQHALHSGKLPTGKGTKAAWVASEPGSHSEPQAGLERTAVGQEGLHRHAGCEQLPSPTICPRTRGQPYLPGPWRASDCKAGTLGGLCPQNHSLRTAPQDSPRPTTHWPDVP